MYKILLLSNTLFESFIGLAMIFVPHVVWGTDNELTHAVARIYGFAVLAIAATSLVLLFLNKTREHLVGGFVTLSIFHIGLTIGQTINFLQGYAQFSDPIIHAIFAFLFTASLIKEISQY